MAVQTYPILSPVARELHISEDALLQQGLRALLERQLREVKAHIFELTGRYGVTSVKEIEARYQEGTLEEADSWRDLQRLDHLEKSFSTQRRRDTEAQSLPFFLCDSAPWRLCVNILAPQARIPLVTD